MPPYTRLARTAVAGLVVFGSTIAAACGGDDNATPTAPPAAQSTATTAPEPTKPASTATSAATATNAAPATAAAAATSAPAATATRATTFDTPAVSVEDNSFGPAAITVAKGTKVTWTWRGAAPHSVTGTFNGRAVDSPVQTSGAFSFTFDTAGTFSYQCGVHGAAMTAKVTVQ